MTERAHWADVLTLRKEVTDAAGQISDLQMSLYSAVFTDRDVPYQDPTYYADITEPTVGLTRFMGAIAARLGASRSRGKALFHLDQGMGGGKSHALVGLYHLANSPAAFLGTELGQAVKAEAEHVAGPIELEGARVVVLSGDNMTPGATSPEFGPATNLYERFLWALFRGDRELYRTHRAAGPNKAALARALEAAGGPVLILLDELMDYVMPLSDEEHLASMPGEKAFLNSLMDAVDEVPSVAFVVVMIRSDLDERGYNVDAEDFRSYVASRLERNGVTVAVTEAQDFSAIIRRRLFERVDELPVAELAARWRAGADDAWQEQVFNKLGASRSLTNIAERLATSYPFSPDLMALVKEDWSRHAGFQRVRSTVEIFAATAYYWTRERAARRWVPELIGVGDLPLAVVVENILSSGLLHGNERAIQGFRQVAATDVISKDGQQGRARELDEILVDRGVEAGQPHPALRMATALFYYSLVPRSQAKRGATKLELISAIYVPDGVTFQGSEEVFNIVVSDDEGLGALEITDTAAGRGQTRYHLAVAQTLRMFFRQAKNAVQPADRDAYLWDRAKELAKPAQGHFDLIIPISRPDTSDAPLSQIFGDVDQNGKTRLILLDPRRWALNNGRDTSTRNEVAELLGVGDGHMPVDNAASCVVVCVNTQKRDTVRKRAVEVLAWKIVTSQLDREDDKRPEAMAELRSATERVDNDLVRAFQHYAYLTRTDKVEVDWKRFDDDTKSALKGSHVWDSLVAGGRAVLPGRLSGEYLKTLINKIPRTLTLKEISQQFYKNPAFPMVPSVDDIRRAVYQTLAKPDRYEVVDANGDALTISSLDELSIGSLDLSLRKAVPPAPADPGDTPKPKGGGERRPGDGGEQPGGRDNDLKDGDGPGKPGKPAAVQYHRYQLEVPNRSLVETEVRRTMANLLSALLDAVDPEIGGDIQLLDLQIAITADPDAVHEIQQRAEAIDATWEEDDLDF
ncbi:DUF499 domain-containing protein [Nonomuraea wenchangensis]|uniref:DUF499 domain-containing protein n=1 Tax=Nonomuraea wenchangensis TaxID=568860 RepID=UPI003711711A